MCSSTLLSVDVPLSSPSTPVKAACHLSVALELLNKDPQQQQRCDACSCCEDTCDNSSCSQCAAKRARAASQPKRNTVTRCQIQRHATLQSAWVVVEDRVYDLTKYLPKHPGGKKSILRNSGGRDCSIDFAWHPKSAQRTWKRYAIGTVVHCQGWEDALNAEAEQRTAANSAASSCAGSPQSTASTVATASARPKAVLNYDHRRQSDAVKRWEKSSSQCVIS